MALSAHPLPSRSFCLRDYPLHPLCFVSVLTGNHTHRKQSRPGGPERRHIRGGQAVRWGERWVRTRALERPEKAFVDGGVGILWFWRVNLAYYVEADVVWCAPQVCCFLKPVQKRKFVTDCRIRGSRAHQSSQFRLCVQGWKCRGRFPGSCKEDLPEHPRWQPGPERCRVRGPAQAVGPPGRPANQRTTASEGRLWLLMTKQTPFILPSISLLLPRPSVPPVLVQPPAFICHLCTSSIHPSIHLAASRRGRERQFLTRDQAELGCVDYTLLILSASLCCRLTPRSVSMSSPIPPLPSTIWNTSVFHITSQMQPHITQVPVTFR